MKPVEGRGAYPIGPRGECHTQPVDYFTSTIVVFENVYKNLEDEFGLQSEMLDEFGGRGPRLKSRPVYLFLRSFVTRRPDGLLIQPMFIRCQFEKFAGNFVRTFRISPMGVEGTGSEILQWIVTSKIRFKSLSELFLEPVSDLLAGIYWSLPGDWWRNSSDVAEKSGVVGPVMFASHTLCPNDRHSPRKLKTEV